MNQVLLMLLLVSVFGSQGKSVSDISHGSGKFTKGSPTNGIQPQPNISKEEFLFAESSTTEQISTTVSQEENQRESDQELSDTSVYNRVQNPTDNESSIDDSSSEEEEPDGPADHAIPYSEHEEPRNVPTKPKYTAPGEWAKPPKDKKVHLEFVPTKLYAQVRKTHTLRKLPRKKAIENAESEEEKENAARLRAVVKNTKVNTVYTEEGYEDSAYDHAGHIRDADFHEGYARKLHDHLDLKKKSEDDDYDDNHEKEENETKDKNYKKIKPEEFKEFDEDDSAPPKTSATSKISDNVLVNPKLVAEKGIEKLQEDLEREAEEMEKGIEISKLEKVQTTTDMETSAGSRERDNYDRMKERRKKTDKKRRKLSSSENVENSTAASMDENIISTDRTTDTTSVIKDLENWSQNSSGLHKYKVDSKSSPNVDIIDFTRTEENPTTVSYGQLFWDYFKTRQDQLTTTEFPLISESTTLNQNLAQPPYIRNLNNFVPYSVYEEPTTIFPILEPEILGVQEITSGHSSVDSAYLKNNGQSSELLPVDSASMDELWQSINSDEQLKMEPPSFLESHSDKILMNDQEISLLNSQKILNSNEESNQNFDSSLFNPTLSSVSNRKPRYKITIRNKSKEPQKPLNLNIQSSNQESSTSSIINQQLTDMTITKKPVSMNENYMKVLMHVKNEKNLKNVQHQHPNSLYRNPQHPNSLQPNNLFLSNTENNLQDLTILRPPLPQKTPDYYYYNVVPRSKPEIDTTLSDWSSIPVSQQRRQVYKNPRMYRIYFDLPQMQRHPLNRKRNTKSGSDLIRGAPPPQKDLIWHNEPIDYVNRGGNGSKQGRNVLRPFRQASNLDGVRGIRAKRRKRRFVGVDDESDIVKGSIVNNGTSNRGEIERAAKNPSIERNCSQKVTRDLEVGLVLDTSQAKQFEEKKSRHCGKDWGEESRVVERESIDVNGYNGRNGCIKSNLRAPRYDDGKKEEGNVIYLVRKERDVEKKDFKARDELKEREELLDETSKVSGRKKRELNLIDLVRKRKDVKKDDSNMARELKQRIELLNKTFQVTDGQKEEKVIDSVEEKKDVHEEVSKIKDELKVHAKLLDEAPTITEDVINQEINSRFNEEMNESKEDNDKEINKGKDDENEEHIDVDVEVPEFDYVEELTEEDHADESTATTEATINIEKYPFYNNEKMPTPSALKYAVDPKRLPTKTYGAMDFYNSRDAYMQCDEVEPNLKVLPEKEEPVGNKDPEGNLPRLKGLGDKLDCFKAKYFDEDPFDNPLFLEKQVEDPVPPAEINGKQFVSRIMMFPKEKDDHVIQKSSRRPENYRQLRKHISNPIVAQKTRRIRYKIYPRTTPRTRRRPESYRVQSSRTKYTKNSKRPQKIERRPVTSASEISSIKLSDSIPYQSQVYEDVMGTIKNLANSYQVRETTTIPASDEITLMDDTVDDVKTNSSTNSTSYRKREKEKNSVSIDIMDRPSDMRINIKGPMPKYQNRYRQSVYKRIRVPQKSRLRVQPVQKPVIGIRTVKRRRKVRIYKRDLKDDLNSSRERKLLVASIELGSQSAEKKEDKIGNRFLKWKENDYQLRNLENSTIEDDKDSSTQENSMTSTKLPKTIDTKRKSKILNSVTINSSNNKDDHEEEESQKVVYTIKDRIRYSKPKGDLWNVGKFVNKTMVEEDKRRNEPRYNYIRRKNPSNQTLTTTESSLLDLTNKINWTETVTTTDKVNELDSQEIVKENRNVEYMSNNTKDDYQNKSENFTNFKYDLINQSNEEDVNKTGSGYAVYESVNEGEVTTTTQKPQLSTSTEFFNLESFLDTDPPKYGELSNEDFEKSFSLNTTNSSDENNKTSDSTNFNETQKGNEHEKEKDEDTSKPFHQSYFSNEESSEKAQTETKVQSSTESSEESSVASKESESEEDRTSFSFTSRPSSPAENYEDEKYSQLGPRINKPAFYHPPFFNYKSFHPKENSEETQESNEEKEEYVFPWYKDKEDRRKRRRSRYRDKMNYEYEYPWERRERLAREDRKREAEKRKGLLRKFNDEEEEAEEASATKYRTNTYPRGRYRFWGRIDSDTSEDRTSDNIESSSEYRPIMRYSSRYNSRNIKLPLDKQLTNIKSRNIEEISRSIKKTLEDNSGEMGTLEETKNDSSQEKKLEKKESVTSYKSRGISRGMIVPEDVTLVPSRKTRNREKSIDNSSMDTLFESRNSSELVKNTLDNSEPQITVVESPREIENSTKQTSKKRRRPSKNAISTMETVTKSATEANRARRRQKPSSTTVATVESTSLVATTTSASKIARRRNQKSKDSKKNYISNVLNKSVNEASNETDTSSKTGTAEQHSRSRKKNQTNELVNESAKNDRNQELSVKGSIKQEHLEKVNDGRGKNQGNETMEERLVDVNQNKEAEESKRIFLPVKSDERFDFKDARIETLSDFDKTHNDYEIGSILKTDANFIPQNRALQLTEQSSREIISTVSWISENYDF